MYKVFFEEEAEADLLGLYEFIATSAGKRTAERFIGRIRKLCLSLADFPRCGKPRDDLGPDIRTLVFVRRVIVAYGIEGDEVRVVHVIYGGREYGSEDFNGP